MIDLINDILFGAVLQPVLDLVGNPDMTANVLIALAFHPSPSRKFPPGCGQEVEILESFVNDHRLTQTSVSLVYQVSQQVLPRNLAKNLKISRKAKKIVKVWLHSS